MDTLIATAHYRIVFKNIELGPLSLRVFQLPNATYCLCLADVIGIETSDSEMRSAMGSKVFRSPILPQSIHIEGIPKPLTPVSFEAAILYWQYRAIEGNSDASLISKALIRRSLRELADEAFNFRGYLKSSQ